MLYETAQDWRSAPHRRVALFGMSGLGKTHIANMLRHEANWFHYSVDFRIGTRYMGEYIADNVKSEAMKIPFLAKLLRSDSIYIASNITFNNLEPLSAYLGKPGSVEKGGIPFETYIKRQRQHRAAEIAATLDAAYFIERSEMIYGYKHFINDTSGSLCEVVDPSDPNDPVMTQMSASTLPVWIRGTAEHLDILAARFEKAPKPMYYSEEFLRKVWDDYLAETGVAPEDVDPDAFIRHGFRSLMNWRLPRYEAMAKNWGVTIEAAEVAELRDTRDFNQLIETAIARNG
ncbi:ATPase [Amaricoccus tamworthensis]|uniref:ATPase n=1 Tax=Amaricoccus tamworthensis TaxID=57002 RepID=UPI003C7CF68A